jgi:Transcriptional regulator, AbiEi antitoxin, Type IV TA system/Transcriptional regulator, AbiEi antitoxin N-terminal domain
LVWIYAILSTVGIQNQDKLNWLQRSLPDGLVADSAWLEKHGYSRSLRNKYVAHGWLDPVARGVYRRPAPKPPSDAGHETLRWQPVVISFQTLLGYPFTVGGRTALELQGFGHYLSSGRNREIHLYGAGKPPGWIYKLKLENRFVFHNVEKLFKSEAGRPNRKKAGSGSGNDLLQSGYIRQPWGQWEWPLTMSSPERAILELLDEVPQRETFHQADVLMDGLRNLSPRRLQTLLVACRNIKVKRLFLWFAERHQHAWLKKLDRKDIDLGHGKRMLVRGGKLDTKFNITVPESIDAGG